MADILFPGLLIGIGGTIAMDIWGWLQSRYAGAAAANWAMPGRWFGHLMRGRVFHDDIAQAEPVGRELALGWAFHYAVGALYGVTFLMIVGPVWLIQPEFLSAWIFALITITAGWFLLQPGMGLGWAASKTPNPWATRGKGLMAHTVFGLGMWGTGFLA